MMQEDSSRLARFRPCTMQDLLLLSASSAMTLNDGPRKHSKVNNPSWEYTGRSFGLGSSVGQSNDTVVDDRVLHYSHTEFGYNTKVSCVRNKTSDLYFRFTGHVVQNISASEYQNTELQFDKTLPSTQSELSTYFVQGYLSNSIMGVPELYPVVPGIKNLRTSLPGLPW